jgi:hypothetical protein
MPLLTRRQFANSAVGKRPDANYAHYVNFVTKKRAARAAAAMNNPLLGFQQALKSAPGQAKGDVKSQIDAALAGYRATTKAAQQQAMQQSTRAQGFATALAKLSAPSAEQTAATYNEAADRMRAFGTGLTGQVQAAQQAEAAQTAQDVARSTGGLGRLVGYDPEAARNAAQYSGVVIPGQSLVEQAANAKTEQRWLNAANAAGIGTIAEQYRQKTVDLQNKLAEQRAALEAQRPKLYSEALTARQTAARNNLSTLIQAQYLGSSLRKTAAEITGRDPYTNKLTFAARSAAQKAADTAAQNAITNALARTRIGISQQNADIARKREAAYERTKRGLPGGLKQSDIRQYGDKAESAVQKYLHGVRNPKFVGKGPEDATSDNPYYSTPPRAANEVLGMMLGAKIPYSIAMNAIAQAAKDPKSPWYKEFTKWFPHGYPPPGAGGVIRRQGRKPGPGAR